MNLFKWIKNALYGMNSSLFKDGITTFLLSSDESPTFKGPYKCRLIKTVFNKYTKAYLIELRRDDLNEFETYIIAPKHIGFGFGKKTENDVYILLPSNLNAELQNEVFPDEVKVIAWGFIYNIQNH